MGGRILTTVALTALVLSACTEKHNDPTLPPRSPSVSVPSTSGTATGTSTSGSSSTSGATTTPTKPTSTASSYVATLPAGVPTTGPNTRPGETAPLMPEEATKHSEAGALAFAKFFVRAMDWSFATNDSTYLRAYADAACSSCLMFADAIDTTQAEGSHYVGLRDAVKSASTESEPGSSLGEFRIRVTVDSTSGYILTRTGGVRSNSAQPPRTNFKYFVSAKWDGGWSVVNLGVGL